HERYSFIPFDLILRPPPSTLFPYTTLFRSGRDRQPLADRAGRRERRGRRLHHEVELAEDEPQLLVGQQRPGQQAGLAEDLKAVRSEEHTSELQSRSDLVCRLLLEKKKKISI